MPGEPAAQERSREIEEIFAALHGSGALDLLRMTTTELNGARTDSALFERLRITHELLMVLGDEDVLGTFLLLPKDDQSNLVRWIGATDAEELRQSRTETFVAALKASPLAENGRHWGSE